MTRNSKVEGLIGVVILMAGLLGLTRRCVAFVVTLVNCQSCPLTRYPMSVVSVVYGPKVMATTSPEKPNFSPGALPTS